MNFKESAEGYMRRFGGKKGKRKMLQFYYNLKNKKYTYIYVYTDTHIYINKRKWIL